MTKKQTVQLEAMKNAIKAIEKEYDFNDYLESYINDQELLDCKTADQLKDYLNKLDEDGQLTDTEVMFYASAIKYLAENDDSLRESLEIAADYGFDMRKLNSEVLASLLKSSNNKDDYQAFINRVCETLY